MQSFLALCFVPLVLQTSGLLVAKRNEAATPGFGLDIAKSVTNASHSDGYFLAGCFTDDNVIHADKHGTGHLMFEPESPISIVWYKDGVDRPKWEPMSPKVCFNFCRTVKDAQFFGLFRGDQCYCAPYYVQTEGDMSTCDMPCEGDSSTTCGGSSKQNLYEMHTCDKDLADIVSQSQAQCQTVVTELRDRYLLAQPLLLGVDKQLQVAELAGVIRESLQEIARGWADNVRNAQLALNKAQEACDELNTVAQSSTDTSLASDIAKIEAAQMLATTATVSAMQTSKTLKSFYDHHTGHEVMKQLNMTMEDLTHRQMPPEWNRMPDWALEQYGCDSDPSDGCTGFDLTYWIGGNPYDHFEEHYESGTMQENGLHFAWMCYEYCKSQLGCVAADVYGTDNSFACRMLSSVFGTRLAKSQEAYGFSFDNGFILNRYFLTPAQDTFLWFRANEGGSGYSQMVQPSSSS